MNKWSGITNAAGGVYSVRRAPPSGLRLAFHLRSSGGRRRKRGNRWWRSGNGRSQQPAANNHEHDRHLTIYNHRFSRYVFNKEGLAFIIYIKRKKIIESNITTGISLMNTPTNKPLESSAARPSYYHAQAQKTFRKYNVHLFHTATTALPYSFH